MKTLFINIATNLRNAFQHLYRRLRIFLFGYNIVKPTGAASLHLQNTGGIHPHYSGRYNRVLDTIR